MISPRLSANSSKEASHRVHLVPSVAGSLKIPTSFLSAIISVAKSSFVPSSPLSQVAYMSNNFIAPVHGIIHGAHAQYSSSKHHVSSCIFMHSYSPMGSQYITGLAAFHDFR